jgi:hypothetical protein
MKKDFLFFLFIFVAFYSNATIRTVNNSSGAAGQYTDLQVAIDASAANDTIYVHASATAYPVVTVVRPIVIFGEGSLPDQQNQFRTVINGVNLSFSSNYSTSSSGSKIYGCRILQLNFTGGNLGCNCPTSGYSTAVYGVSNVNVERCDIRNLNIGALWSLPNATVAYGVHENVTFINNIIYRIDSGIMRSCLFANNIIRDSGIIDACGCVNSENNVFVNNTVVGTIFTVAGAQVLNNHFETYTAHFGNVNFQAPQSFLVNNVFKTGIPDYSGYTVTNCLFNAGAMSISAVYNEDGSTGQVWASSYSDLGPFPNFHLITGALGDNFGTDGTDVGIYGGAFPWVDYLSSNLDERFRYYAPPRQLPVLQHLSVSTPIVSPSGQLNIQIKAKSQN